MRLANFEPWYDEVWGVEGIWYSDPGDPGADTYRGVSMRSHSRHDLWDLIRPYRALDGFPECLDDDPGIRAAHRQLFFKHYWNGSKAGSVAAQAQEVAAILCDVRANMGPAARRKVARSLQEGVNRWSPPEESDLIVDGVVGPNTIRMLNRTAVLDSWVEGYVDVVAHMVERRLEAYVHLVKRRPARLKFLWGWQHRTMMPLRRLLLQCTYAPIPDELLPQTESPPA